MQIGETDLPIGVAILLIIFILSIIFNIFLFTRGHGSYSVKYEIMLNDKNFRRHQWLTQFVEVVYKSFFVLPFLLLIAMAIIQALSKLADIPIILVNGLIVLLITYPFKTDFYYIKEVIIWVFAVASQFIALFLQANGQSMDYYSLLCTIFYPINCILFCLALMSREDNYWEIQYALAIPSVEAKLKEIYPAFTQKEDHVIRIEENQKLRENQYFEQTTIREKTVTKFVNIPQIFNGGIFGSLCRERLGYKFTILYLLSLCILAINAGTIWKTSGSSLGVIGLITNFIYDMFIFSFNVLPTPERSIRNVFILVFLGRFLSFIFGQELWIFGYCILYFFVGVFIGKILINNRLPLRNIRKKAASKKVTNAFRTPEFVLFILTVEIALLVLASSFGIGGSNASVSYSESVKVPLWQFAILVVIATWVVILYMASVRMYDRNINSIKQEVEYYFGSKAIKEYHIYIVITYFLIIALGLYCNFALSNQTALVASIFLPVILLSLNKFLTEWINNEYQMLADVPQYNRKLEKRNRIIEKKEKAINRQKSKKEAVPSEKDQMIETQQVLIKSQSQHVQQSKLELLSKSESNSEMLSNGEANQQIQRLQSQKKALKLLEDWRQFEGSMNLRQFWKCLTPSDKWIIRMVVTIIVLFVGFVLCDYFASKSLFGVFIVICLVSLLSLMPFYRYACTFKQFIPLQYVWYEFGFVLGVAYWAAYNSESAFAMIWAAIYILSLAGMLSYGVAKKIEKKLIYWLILNMALTICFICIFLGFTAPPIVAIIVSVVLCLACIGGIPVAFIYIEGYLPTHVKVICGVLIGGGVVVLSVVGFALGFASDFAVFTFVMACIYIILMIVASAMFYQKQADKYENPHVYSAFGQPIFKFDSAAEQLKSSKTHKVLFDVASVLLVVYAAAVALIFIDKQWAIYSLGIYCCTTFFINILFSLKTYEELADYPAQLTEDLMLKTLGELDEKYMLDFKENKYSQQLEQQKDLKKQQAEQETDPDKLDTKWLQIAKLNSECIKNRQQEYKFLYFWIALIEFHIFTKAKAKMVTFINQVKEIEEQLIQNGIFLGSLSYALDFATKYELLTQEVQSLGPIDYINFQLALKRHQKESNAKKEQQNKKGEDINNQQLKKQERIFQNLAAQLNKTTNEAIEQFNTLTKGLGKKDLYQDIDFPHHQNSLGSTLSSVVEKWRRPTSKEVLIKGSISPYDVRQGKIGDCYLISSLGVLGDKWILPALGYQSEDKRKWVNQKGAYMVKFFKFSKEIYVTIDDYLPVDDHDDYVFAKSEEEHQIWPCILEKAYAKLYGGYESIEEGQCHRVFAQLSGGVPFEVLTKDYESNPNGLWQKITSSRANNYLMAAGSNAHELGDQACSKRNIVYGHAYSILDAKEVEGYKLMKLKNPHGSGGKEWNGDFSDNSQYMNDRMLQLLGHEKKDDGVFWMKLDDFMHQYRSLYICAIFDDTVFKKYEVNGAFTEENSFGTPSKSQNTFKNPQYGIVVHNKATIFVNLTQKDTQGTFLGKNFIFMRVQKTNGKRISKFNKNEGVCGLPQKSKNTISVSTEVVLEADSYPCTFTLYVSTADERQTGEYKLEIYCTDKSAQFIPDEQFDRENF